MTRIHEKPYFEGLTALTKDDIYSKGLAFKLLIPLLRKGVYIEEIKNAFKGGDFKTIKLDNLNLSDISFEETIFEHAKLKNIDFRGCDLEKTNFNNAKIENCKIDSGFEKALTKEFDFQNIKGTKFFGVNISKIKVYHIQKSDLNLVKEMFKGALYDEGFDIEKNFQGEIYENYT